MTIAHRFMEIARRKLDAETYDSIYAAAVAAERRRIEEAPTLPADERVEKPALSASIEAAINDLPAPPPQASHVAERLEERADIQVGPNELGELKRMVRDGDRNAKITKTRMESIAEAEVSFMGRHFIVVYNKSRDHLITAYLKRSKKSRNKYAGPRKGDWRRDALDQMQEACNV
ncbi:hypothetical protein M5E06_17540 [Azospirillum sp. A1-3]|uniref:hypothetical protein n=1 Tax=Azospirillum sp. A1-3 TaxID=185874 RepID=UPI0020779AC0|nr:hypothetical protein [Azospirillum sp. A1-3]MCM8735938.1 hypothetical protein [Azospirillum sp. A1-3]